MENLDLSNGFIGPDELQTMAKCMSQYSIAKESQYPLYYLNLSSNRICGVNTFGIGDYDISGLTTLCNFFQTSLYLRRLSICDNIIGNEGCQVISKVLLSSCPLKELM